MLESLLERHECVADWSRVGRDQAPPVPGVATVGTSRRHQPVNLGRRLPPRFAEPEPHRRSMADRIGLATSSYRERAFTTKSFAMTAKRCSSTALHQGIAPPRLLHSNLFEIATKSFSLPRSAAGGPSCIHTIGGAVTFPIRGGRSPELLDRTYLDLANPLAADSIFCAKLMPFYGLVPEMP
jgi:hypothetical protein